MISLLGKGVGCAGGYDECECVTYTVKIMAARKDITNVISFNERVIQTLSVLLIPIEAEA